MNEEQLKAYRETLPGFTDEQMEAIRDFGTALGVAWVEIREKLAAFVAAVSPALGELGRYLASQSWLDDCPNRKVVHLAKHGRKWRTRKKNLHRAQRIMEKEAKKKVTKEELKAYIELRKERNDLKRRIVELEAVMYGPRSQRLDGMPRSGSGTNYVQEERLDRMAELLEQYEAKEAELTAALVEIENAIKKLEPRERLLVRLHYIDGQTWEQVAVEMGYSWRQVHRIHSDALDKLKEEELTT